MGGNGDSHNHNDTGSITVYKNGRPFLIDIGVESYTQKTFSPRRYEIWTMQSGWHNLPTFDGVMQLPGADYAARDVQVGDGVISAELAGAYPPVPGLTYYRRTAAVTPEGVALTDQTDWDGEVELTLMTERQPSLCDGGLALEELGVIHLDGPAEISVQPVPVSDPRLRTAWPYTIWKISLYFYHHIHLTLT